MVKQIPNLISEAIAAGAWRDPGPEALRQLLGFGSDLCDLKLFEDVATMHHVHHLLDAGYADDPVFCMVRGSDRVDHGDSRLVFEQALFIAGSRFPGDDVFVALDLRGSDPDPSVLVFDWSKAVPERWVTVGTLGRLVEGLASRALVARVHELAVSRSAVSSHGLATEEQIRKTEETLGFSLPPFLKVCYTEVGNGGFGPGYGVIGVDGGAESDYGTLVGTYRQLKTDQELVGNEWRAGLLPFCEWGCNIFSCVDCDDPMFGVWKFEDFEVRHQGIGLEEFFERWLAGADLIEADDVVEESIVNPFTGERAAVTKRKDR